MTDVGTQRSRRKDVNRVSLSLKRNDLVTLIRALESVIEDLKYDGGEDLKYDGGLVLAEDEMRLLNRLETRLRSHDTTPFRRSADGWRRNSHTASVT